MDQVHAFVGIAAVLVLSLPLALGLEWFCLRGVLRYMPAAGRRAKGSPRGVRAALPGVSRPGWKSAA